MTRQRVSIVVGVSLAKETEEENGRYDEHHYLSHRASTICLNAFPRAL